jgi:hypothetical protein
MRTRRYLVRIGLPIAVAVASGIFLSIASHALNWSSASIVVVGGALAAILGLLGTPLLLLSGAPGPSGLRSDEGPSESLDLGLGDIAQIYIPLLSTMKGAGSLEAENVSRSISTPPAALNVESGGLDLHQMQSILRDSYPYLRRQGSGTSETDMVVVDFSALLRQPSRKQDPASINVVESKSGTYEALAATYN